MRTLFPTPLPIGQQQFAPPFCQAPATSSTDPATGKITVTNQCFGQGLQYAFPNNKTPYTQNWGLNLQFEPRQRMLLEMGYQGSPWFARPAPGASQQRRLAADRGKSK